MEAAPIAKQSAPSAADQVLAQAACLANLSEGVADRTKDRLARVMRDAPPCDRAATPSPDYPALFHQLREYLWRIEANLHVIDTCVERTEL